ncbi:uncharacterized protein STEHIDRAFT_92810 [Stereum hirsutum FP-91666 SS1]|uniref:uncharacterized protein n=1 Tax=Stereum hirsutum (strain FP-91666) TaxID=721885 RepID=UPI000440D7C5|nr:uncharacterized protein STEHIDRAFT_92810 [Stereum hirsutum FP-91666 SS1]EIM90084.1 hypothetical protein STEHIDRAFT_92810 [Stereum hirsutum FP-91666 SS1]
MVLIDLKPSQDEVDAEARTQTQPAPVPPPAYPAASSSAPQPSTSYRQPARPPAAAAYPPPGSPYTDRANPYGNQWVGDSYRTQFLHRCNQGDHDVTTSFGLCGIVCAILLFPIGLMCLVIDTEKKCARCGARID